MPALYPKGGCANTHDKLLASVTSTGSSHCTADFSKSQGQSALALRGQQRELSYCPSHLCDQDVSKHPPHHCRHGGIAHADCSSALTMCVGVSNPIPPGCSAPVGPTQPKHYKVSRTTKCHSLSMQRASTGQTPLQGGFSAEQLFVSFWCLKQTLGFAATGKNTVGCSHSS